jgi:site-specific DNA recombinase
MVGEPKEAFDMGKVVIYRRISVSSDSEPCAAQEDRLLAWAAREGHTVIGNFCDDGISGKTMTARPGVMAAIDFVCRHRGAMLAVTALSRLGRGTLGILETMDRLQRAGCKLMSMAEPHISDDSPVAVLMRNLVASTAEWERLTIALRTRDSMAWLRRQNRLIGSEPYGWRAEGSMLVELPHEQVVLRNMAQMRAEGMSFARIGDALNTAGHPAKRGGMWSGRAVRLVLGRLAKLKAA